MNCQEFKEYMYRFLDNELEDARLQKECKEHLVRCPVCSLEIEGEKKFNKLIKDHLIKEEAPYELKEAVIKEIDETKSFKDIFDWSWLKKAPSLTAVTAIIVIMTFTVVTVFSRPFPVFAESVNRHVEYLKGEYPFEIRTNDINEALAWFEGKLDFKITRPHLDPSKAKLVGARICHLKDQKVAYFMYESQGRHISAFVMDYDGLKLPRLDRSQIHDHGNNVLYVKGQKGFESFLCFHKNVKTGCILVSDIPEDELMRLMG